MGSSGSTSPAPAAGQLGFAWWQFTGWAGLIVGTLFSLAQIDKIGGLAVFLAVVNVFLAVMIIKYSKYAFLLGTVLSLNPIVWVINGIYLRNRWNDPRLMENSPSQDGASTNEAGGQSARSTELAPALAPAQAATLAPARTSVSVPASAEGASTEAVGPVGDERIGVAAKRVVVRSDEDLWSEAMAEADSERRRPGLWAKCYGEAGGVESATRAAYMSARVQEMKAAQATEAAAAEMRRRAEEQESRLASLSEEKRAYEKLPKGTCPNCEAIIPAQSMECPRCKAAFGPGSSWKVRPQT